MANYIEYLDDTSSRISYEGNWIGESGWEVAEAKTIHVTHDASAVATLTFNGTSIRVVAVPFAITGNFSVTLDDTNFGDVSLWGGQDAPAIESTTVWSANGLDPFREHVIKIQKSTNDTLWESTMPNYPVSSINLDMFVVESDVSQAPSPSPSVSARVGPPFVQTISTSPGPKSTSSSTSSTIDQTSSSITPSETEASSQGSGKPSVGAIVGGVLGGLLWIAIVIASIIWWRRYRDSVRTPLPTGALPSYHNSQPTNPSMSAKDYGNVSGVTATRTTEPRSPSKRAGELAPMSPPFALSPSPLPETASGVPSSNYPYPTSYTSPPSPIYEDSEAAQSSYKDSTINRVPYSSAEEPWLQNHPYSRGGLS